MTTMMRMTRIFLAVTLILSGSILSGCGREIKLSVRAAPEEREQPSTALVRRLELSYERPGGGEQWHQSVAVLGLSQPVSLKTDLNKEVNWEAGGTWSAMAYTGDGAPILAGTAHPDPDETDAVEITLGRHLNGPSALAPLFLKRVSLGMGFEGSRVLLEQDKIRGAIAKGECAAIDERIGTDPDSRRFPTLVMESSTPNAPLSVEVEYREGEKAWKQCQIPPMPGFTATGHTTFTLNVSFCAEAALNPPATFRVRTFYGDEKRPEACFTLSTVRQLSEKEGIAAVLLEGPGRGKPTPGGILEPPAKIEITNPNSWPADVEMCLRARQRNGEKALFLALDSSGEPRDSGKFEVFGRGCRKVSLEGGGRRIVFVHGAFDPKDSAGAERIEGHMLGGHPIITSNIQFELDWRWGVRGGSEYFDSKTAEGLLF